jgi:ABC-type multidrug transport system fused ATPase/permease subunit
MFLNQKYGEICDEGNAQACSLYKENYTSVWEPGVGLQAIYLFFGGIVWFLLLLLGEAGIFPRREPQAFRSPAREEEADVAAERQRVLSNTKKDDCLVVKGLTKVYRKKGGSGRFTAVDNLTFGVPAGQCFGLLGVNGAGKTTTFNALTGEIPMTKGEITAAGYDLRHHSSEARQHMGYCPQYDALIGLLVRTEGWEAAGV